jgi:hypothetical protein
MLASDKPLSGVAAGIESFRAADVVSVLIEGFSAVPVAVAERSLRLHAPHEHQQDKNCGHQQGAGKFALQHGWTSISRLNHSFR